VFDRWEGVVVVVQELTPLLVLRRPPESLRVILKTPPHHEQEVAVRLLYAPMQLKRLESRRRDDKRLRLGKGALEVALLARLYVKYGLLRDHNPDSPTRLDERFCSPEAKQRPCERAPCTAPRHRAATLALIGAGIANTARWEGDEVSEKLHTRGQDDHRT